ncbi:MAG: DUF6784 domain-containing protein [Thermoproteota archaeon]
MGVSAKAIFKVVPVTVVLAPFLGNIGFIWVSNTFGMSKLPTPSTWVGSSYITGWANAESAINGGTGPTPWIGQAIPGFIVTVGLSYLHARFTWFPFEPIGFLIATDYCGMLSGIWSAFLIDWLVKTLMLRVGGSRAYEQYGVSVAIGFIFGIVITKVVGGAVLVLRFFYPW